MAREFVSPRGIVPGHDAVAGNAQARGDGTQWQSAQGAGGRRRAGYVALPQIAIGPTLRSARSRGWPASDRKGIAIFAGYYPAGHDDAGEGRLAGLPRAA